MLVLLNVADWSDTDTDETGHRIPQTVIAERSGISLWHCRQLMTRAVQDGWLDCPQPGGQGRSSLWKLSVNFAATSRRHREVFALAPYENKNNFALAPYENAIDGGRRRRQDGEPRPAGAGVSPSAEIGDGETPIYPVALTPSSQPRLNPRATGTNPRAIAAKAAHNTTYAHVPNWSETPPEQPDAPDPASWKTHLAEIREVLAATRRHPANRNGNGGIIVASSADSDTDETQ